MHSIMFIANNIDHENLIAFSNSNHRFTFLKLASALYKPDVAEVF